MSDDGRRNQGQVGGGPSNKRRNLTKPRPPFTLPARFQNAALQVMRGRWTDIAHGFVCRGSPMGKTLIASLLLVGSSCRTESPSSNSSLPPQPSIDADADVATLTAGDVQALLESEIGLLVELRAQAVANQDSIPLQLDGVSGTGPSVLFGKPVVRTADYIKSSVDSAPARSVLLALVDQAGGQFRVKLSQSGGTFSINAEAWVAREGATWRIVDVLWKSTTL